MVALNRRLTKASLLKAQRAHLWAYTDEEAARRCLTTSRLALRWQRLPAFQKLGRMLTRHLDGLVNSCHETVPVGTVEAIHGNIRAMRRRDRGAWDHDYLLLKVQKAPASRHPHHTA
jgi:transposase